jgi:N-acetylmuramoyl-L-alanine amidase
MNGRMIPVAVAALMIAGMPATVLGPAPSPEAADRLAALRPRHESPALKISPAEMHCLAQNIYYEARGESEEGQAAVAHVTLNRVEAQGFPASICGVVHQGRDTGICQFGWSCTARHGEPGTHGPGESAAWKRAQAVAKRALAGGIDPTEGALYFHHLKERPQWAIGRYAHKVVIGEHIFFSVAETGRRLATR